MSRALVGIVGLAAVIAACAQGTGAEGARESGDAGTPGNPGADDAAAGALGADAGAAGDGATMPDGGGIIPSGGGRAALLDSRTGHALAALGSTVVLFGGYDGDFLDDTWEWSHGTWTKKTPLHHPPARADHAMATLGNKVVLFGGEGPSAYDDTWEWDGNDWTLRTPAHAPVLPNGYGMGSRPLRARMAPLGGALVLYLPPDLVTPRPPSGTTWSWDGADWTKTTSTSPGTDAGPMAALGSKIVMHAGGGPYMGAAETWEFDGSTWTQRAAGPGYAAAMAPWGNRVVAAVPVGGESSSETWEWDGASWTRLTPAKALPARDGAAMATTQDGTVVLYGGIGAASNASLEDPLDDTWTWDGTSWTRTPAVAPAGGTWAVAENGHQLVLVRANNAGYEAAATWVWDGSAWTEMHPTVIPQGAGWGSYATASRGGTITLLAYDDALAAHTFEWTGSDWSEKITAHAPPWDDVALAACGPNVVDFTNGQTWVWDGTDWTEKTVATAPAARYHPAIGSLGGKVVLFGGRDKATAMFRDDTWEWDGQAWTQKSPAVSPEPRQDAITAMAPLGGGLVLFGGDDGNAPLPTMWLWDGTSWTRRTTGVPSPRFDGALAASPGGGVVLFGGRARTGSECEAVGCEDWLRRSDMWIVTP